MHRILDFGSRNLDCSGMSRRKSILSKLAGGVYGASHRIPLVGFLIAAIFAMGWWHFRTEPSVPLQWVAVGLGVIAIFFDRRGNRADPDRAEKPAPPSRPAAWQITAVRKK
jgi:hypothetical protein